MATDNGGCMDVVAEKRSHKRLDPDIKALRAINRALEALPDDKHRQRVMEWMVARGLGKSWITLPRFRWITGGDRAGSPDMGGETMDNRKGNA